MRKQEAIEYFVLDVGNILIYTLLVWFICQPNVNIWFLFIGWCIGAAFTLWRRTR